MHGGNAPQASNATVEHFSARAERIALAAFHNALVSIYDDLGLCQAHATYSHTNTRIWHHQHDCLPLFCQNYLLGPPPTPPPAHQLHPTQCAHSCHLASRRRSSERTAWWVSTSCCWPTPAAERSQAPGWWGFWPAARISTRVPLARALLSMWRSSWRSKVHGFAPQRQVRESCPHVVAEEPKT